MFAILHVLLYGSDRALLVWMTRIWPGLLDISRVRAVCLPFPVGVVGVRDQLCIDDWLDDERMVQITIVVKVVLKPRIEGLPKLDIIWPRKMLSGRRHVVRLPHALSSGNPNYC
jgi:hypothetical protein